MLSCTTFAVHYSVHHSSLASIIKVKRVTAFNNKKRKQMMLEIDFVVLDTNVSSAIAELFMYPF